MRQNLLPAVSLSLLAAGCFGDGPDAVRLFLNLQADSLCGQTEIIVDLDAADAELLRDGGGRPECNLVEELAERGCEVDFDDLEGGKLVRIHVDCDLEYRTPLLECAFERVMPLALGQHITSTCECADETCSTTPGICVSDSADPTTCEDCSNEVDDDGNGYVDCDDAYCIGDLDCYFSTTTESTSTTSFTTTSTTSTTHSTLDRFSCDVTFRLADAVELGALQWSVNYEAMPGDFFGAGSSVECISLVQDTIASFNDEDDIKTLAGGIVSLQGFSGPLNVAQCETKVFLTPVTGNFSIVVTDASNVNSEPVDPLPALEISSIDCNGVE